MRPSYAALGLVAALAAPMLAHAGRTCTVRAQTVESVQRGLDLAAATAAALDRSGAQVVLLARAGQDLSKYGLDWSHLGFAYRGDAGEAWRVLHKLNQCGSEVAAIYRQGLGEFFLEHPHRYAAAYAVLSEAAQTALLPILRDDRAVLRWHEPRYNMVAYPWSTRYQQSNQWALETLAGAVEPAARDRGRAQAWLQLQGYAPTTLKLGPLTRLGARATMAHIAFDDHPDGRRFRDRIDTVTVDSVFRWLPIAGWGQAAVQVEP
ncbi:MAG: DUF2145 domain-containing protein [Xanthomonadales bacterium]|jgi:hypothetical protein|nr:DUF2145 domain-containing protein [Xanthomonadales bacterium]